MIVTTGINGIKTWIRKGTGNPPTHIGVGIGTTAEAAGNTALVNEVYPTTTRNTPQITKSEDVVFFYMNQATTEGSTATYTEHGLFTNSTTGTMFSRQTHPNTKKSDIVVMDSFIGLGVDSFLP